MKMNEIVFEKIDPIYNYYREEYLNFIRLRGYIEWYRYLNKELDIGLRCFYHNVYYTDSFNIDSKYSICDSRKYFLNKLKYGF